MTTKVYTKDEIVEKAKEIAHMIANTEEVEFFKKAEEQINENQFVREKIASLKTLQKQAINFFERKRRNEKGNTKRGSARRD